MRSQAVPIALAHGQVAGCQAALDTRRPRGVSESVEVPTHLIGGALSA